MKWTQWTLIDGSSFQGHILRLLSLPDFLDASIGKILKVGMPTWIIKTCRWCAFSFQFYCSALFSIHVMAVICKDELLSDKWVICNTFFIHDSSIPYLFVGLLDISQCLNQIPKTLRKNDWEVTSLWRAAYDVKNEAYSRK